MKIAFVYPDLLDHRMDWPGYFYVGIATLSAVLKRQGHQTSLMHLTHRINREDFVARVKAENADLIAYSVTSHMFPYLQDYTKWLHEAGVKTPTICGGLHPTVAPEETLELDGMDIICRSDGR